MNSGQHYILRAFDGEREVITSTVAIVPDANSYPGVGQGIDNVWRVMEILDGPTGEYWIRVMRLSCTNPSAVTRAATRDLQ